MSQSSLYDLLEVDEVGAQREKRTRASSSDTEETKPPTKMAKEEPTLMDLKRLLDDVKREQGAFKKLFSTRIEALKTELVTTIDSKVSSLKKELNDKLGKLDKKLAKFENRLEALEDKVSSHECTGGGGQLSEAVKLLQYKAVDQEARSRRCNLLVYNVAETADDDTEKVFLDFLSNRLGIEQHMAIQRVHRLGRKPPRHDDGNTGGRKKIRPIIVCLRDYPDVEKCMANSKKLAGSGLGISRDYPGMIRMARKRLEEKKREAVRQKKKVSVVYPAKLIVDGQMVADEIPDWREVLKDSV